MRPLMCGVWERSCQMAPAQSARVGTIPTLKRKISRAAAAGSISAHGSALDREPDRLPAAPGVRRDVGRVVINLTLGN